MEKERKNLVRKLHLQGYIRTDSVEKAMGSVPREEFLPDDKRPYAYLDQPLSIGEGQTISAPHMVAIICEELSLKEGMNVLEIGTGFGYNAAVVAEIIGKAGHVYTIERIRSLLNSAKKNLKSTGYSERVTVVHGDGSLGISQYAPYDRIYVTAAAPEVPQTIKDQLKVGGMLLVPVGEEGFYQELILMEKLSKNDFKTTNLGSVAFVPLIGEYGW
ncbi:protein-L-isoaspartate O-methyltransferase [Methanobacterium alcaliphilum]|nr:protein-L-isoaspartate O-methyltransferase [Methanobacterium alcaliphilum]MCK9150895.1 protein-L-isoaspartate O-methyltransferase [Methanobacterium alcaliphilum]